MRRVTKAFDGPGPAGDTVAHKIRARAGCAMIHDVCALVLEVGLGRRRSEGQTLVIRLRRLEEAR